MKFLVLTLLVVSGAAFASDGHHGPSTLIAPAVNVLILISAIVFLVRKPAKEFFSSKSSTISQMIDSAASKAKEAQTLMEMQKKKTSGADAEIKQMESDSKATLENFEKAYKEDIKERIAYMKEDAGSKIEAEKKELLSELNSNLLDLVISKAKADIKSNSSLSESATQNILKGL